MMFTNEIEFLRLHLPVSAQGFDGIVAITDPKTTDGSLEFMQSIGAEVLIRDWCYNWGYFASLVFQHAENLGYDAACRLDPDECLMPGAAGEIRGLLMSRATLLVLPRYEFFRDRRHFRVDLYPDAQARAWRLRRGILVQGRRHEGIDFTAHGLYEGHPDPDRRVLRASSPHLYHYGYASRHGIWNNMIKYTNHARIEAGLPPVDDIPADTPLLDFPTIEFCDAQPLDPAVVGATAPFEE